MTRTIEIEISELQCEILQELESDGSWCKGYDQLEEATKSSLIGSVEARKILQKEIAFLRSVGLVEYWRGCMNDDGEVAGSGFCRSATGNNFIEKYDL